MEYPEHYKILELPIDADINEIKRQYRKMAKKYHPDLNQENKAEAEEKFKKLKEAYEVLSDENKRTAYDLEWKKQRKDEQKARRKPQPEKPKEKTVKTPEKVKKETPAEQKKSPIKPREKAHKKSGFSFKIFRLFFSLVIISAVMFFSAPKVLQHKEKIHSSLREIKELAGGLDSYFVQKEVQNNEVKKIEEIIKKTEEKNEKPQDIANFKNADGYSLLMLSKTAEMSKMLLENGAEVNYVAPDGGTALLQAVKNNNKAQVEVLLSAGATAEIKDAKSGYNALMLAKSDDIAYLLLRAGANPNFVAKDGTTALSKATKEHNRTRLNLLQQFGAQINWSDVIFR